MRRVRAGDAVMISGTQQLPAALRGVDEAFALVQDIVADDAHAGLEAQADAIRQGMAEFKAGIQSAEQAGYYTDVRMADETDFPLLAAPSLPGFQLAAGAAAAQARARWAGAHPRGPPVFS